MKKFSTLVLLIITTLTIGSCGKTDTNRKIVLKCGHAMNPAHPVSVAIKYFAKRVNDMSDGNITVKIFPNEELGNQNDLIQQVQLGCLDIVKTSASELGNFIPVYSILGMPYLYENETQYWNVLEGPIGREILDSGAPYGLKGITFYDAGSRSFYTKNKPIKSPKDLKGLKIRVQPSLVDIKMLKCLGGSPTPLPFGELYTALQQGVVDGAENNIPSFYTTRHYEICRYYCFDEHTRVPDVLLISQIVWDELPSNAQEIILKAANESLQFQKKLWDKQRIEEIEKMKKKGVEFIEVEKKPFKEKVQIMYQKLKPAFKKIVEEITSTDDKKDLIKRG